MRKTLHATAVLFAYTSVSLAGSSHAATTPNPAGSNSKGWAYSPVQAPTLPRVADERWVLTPVDRFVLQKLEEKHLKPSRDAEREAYIRRATLDAWGLIPTPEEVSAFVNDKSPKAYEKLVDRLLASPRYGERWGRRWLDLTRYADSDGYNADGTRPNIWRYRDYVIQAYNEDKPYDRFIKEQLAGDELWPDSHEARIATGFLRNYPDEINARDLNLKQVEVATDLTNTVGSVLLATTVACAACHNHKFDKISQKEYYQLQSYFVNASAQDDILAAQGKERETFLAQQARWEEATKEIRDRQTEILKPVIKKLEDDRLQGFTPATREAIEKPAEQRNAYERWIYNRSLWTLSGRTRNAVNTLKTKDKEGYAEYQKLDAKLKEFDHLKPKHPGFISAMVELGKDTPATYVLANGIYDRHLEEVQPGVPALLGGNSPEIKPTDRSSGRRTAIANWIVSPDNPLTARVYVNRVWAQYFGKGIVETLGDFGKQGAKPTHPELLDHLASEFVKGGWKLKPLQREILLSHTYRQASIPRADVAKVDPANKLLATFPRQRLDAEQIRDSLIYAAGLLNEKQGGPSVFPPVPKSFNSALNAANFWKTSDDPHDYYRRSVYTFVRRNSPYPFLDSFDWANPQLVHQTREVTTTAPQALALLNSDLVFEWSRALAGRVEKEAGKDDKQKIDRIYSILYSRKPSDSERTALLAFWKQQESAALKKLQAGKSVPQVIGYGITAEAANGLDRAYQSLYGRKADRLEQVAFQQFIDSQRKLQASKGGGGDEDGGADIASDAGSEAGKQKGSDKRTVLAHQAGLVSLVHTLANANEFVYRF
ncbi:DUF1549 and DUF1553 domain-containing protein [Burkholderiaceae bacterium DAT-1]|nr:DUF1549 and DUF1553 domain-containing protein [Burkholderiaceae bacterium DAT-1]